MKKDSKKKGFTLIELIVVIAILGILAAVLIPKFSGFQDKAHSTQALVEAKQWATAADAYLVEHPEITAATAVTAVQGAAVDPIAKTAGTNGKVTVSSVDVANNHVFFKYVTNDNKYSATRKLESDGVTVSFVANVGSN